MSNLLSHLISSLILVSFFNFTALLAFAGGTSVGNGGDTLFYFLEDIRRSLVATMKNLDAKNPIHLTICNLAHLTAAQRNKCHDVLIATQSQWLRLNQGENKTKFLLKEEPLLVPGPGGIPQKVDARTLLGPDGDIEFHRDSIKLYSPIQMMKLISHEFGHKLIFQEKSIGDDEPFPPFDTGREFLDAVAASLTNYAQNSGLIGSQFGLRDHFVCRIELNGFKVPSLNSTLRRTFDSGFKRYETSLSKLPKDPLIAIGESSETNLVFQVVIHETQGCKKIENEPGVVSPLRSTTLRILRSPARNKNLTHNNRKSHVEEIILVERVLEGFNPICEEKSPYFGLEYQNVSFKCRHDGTEVSTLH